MFIHVSKNQRDVSLVSTVDHSTPHSPLYSPDEDSDDSSFGDSDENGNSNSAPCDDHGSNSGDDLESDLDILPFVTPSSGHEQCCRFFQEDEINNMSGEFLYFLLYFMYVIPILANL